MNIQTLFLVLILVSGTSACTEEETVVIPNNTPPTVSNVPSIKIERYVNRMFIDLLGREPLNQEMDLEVAKLRNEGLSSSAREALITKLQTATDFIAGDTSYIRAYALNTYNLAKIRCLEGASDEEIVNFIGLGSEEDGERLFEVLNIKQDFESGVLPIHQLFGRIIHNLVYDQINMNTFNFVNATFDNLYMRFPTDAEFGAGFEMIENGAEQLFLGQIGQNKTDYVDIFINNPEMFEGLIIWTYQLLLGRRPTTLETVSLLEDFLIHQDIRIIQRAVLVTDEYANF